MMTQSGNELPEACAWAFKEWSGVCRALAEGRQSLILRKGGVAEANGQFAPEHRAFWLYPTHLHESQQGLREDMSASPAAASGATVPIEVFASVTRVGHVTQLEALQALAGHHAWTEETVAHRFHYRTPGLWVLGVRVYRLDRPVLIEATPAYAGCKSWVELDRPIATRDLQPVLAPVEYEREMESIGALIGLAQTDQPA